MKNLSDIRPAGFVPGALVWFHMLPRGEATYGWSAPIPAEVTHVGERTCKIVFQPFGKAEKVSRYAKIEDLELR